MLHILLAEDNRGDVWLVRESLRLHGIDCRLHVVEHGEAALHFLARAVEAGGENSPQRPDLLLLDLNLPGVDGPYVLQELRKNPALADLPVVILTSSYAPNDRETVSALGISGYFQKPCDLEGFMELGAVVRGAMMDTPES